MYAAQASDTLIAKMHLEVALNIEFDHEDALF